MKGYKKFRWGIVLAISGFSVIPLLVLGLVIYQYRELPPLLRARSIIYVTFGAGILVILIGAVLVTRALMKELARLEGEKEVLEALAMQSEKMAVLGRMAASIAHEISNPLAVIGEKAGWLQDLLRQENLAQDSRFREFADTVDKIENQVHRARKITHRLLGFTRRPEPIRERVDLNPLLEETLGYLENEANYRNIQIHTDFAESLPPTTSDSTQLQQVFLNILHNAVEAIGADGEIKVKTGHIAAAGNLAVEISDNGPGIPREMQDKIFDPFFTTKEVGRGTGLGLSISRTIVEKLGGRITVAGEEGRGATFIIYLPIR